MKPYEQATNRLTTRDQLDQVRMSPGERRMARAYLRQAELLAEMLMRMGAELRRVFGVIGRGIGAVAGRGRVVAARPDGN